MQEKSWEIKEIPTWVSQKEASALRVIRADDVREIRTGKEKVIRVAYLYAENDAYEHR